MMATNKRWLHMDFTSVSNVWKAKDISKSVKTKLYQSTRPLYSPSYYIMLKLGH